MFVFENRSFNVASLIIIPCLFSSFPWCCFHYHFISSFVLFYLYYFGSEDHAIFGPNFLAHQKKPKFWPKEQTRFHHARPNVTGHHSWPSKRKPGSSFLSIFILSRRRSPDWSPSTQSPPSRPFPVMSRTHVEDRMHLSPSPHPMDQHPMHQSNFITSALCFSPDCSASFTWLPQKCPVRIAPCTAHLPITQFCTKGATCALPYGSVFPLPCPRKPTLPLRANGLSSHASGLNSYAWHVTSSKQQLCSRPFSSLCYSLPCTHVPSP